MRKFVIVPPRSAVIAGFPRVSICCLALQVTLLTHAAPDKDDDDQQLAKERDRRPIEELFKTDTVFPQLKGDLEVGVSTLFQKNLEGDTLSFLPSLESQPISLSNSDSAISNSMVY
jgi:hypothetical protein